MLDMGFMPDIKRIIARLPQQRQNLLFSATMPQAIRKFADKILVNPETIQVSNTEPVTNVEHSFYTTQDNRKVGILETLLSKNVHDNVLIFTRTKHKAKKLSQQLLKSGYDSTSLQGNMNQGQRQRALDGFRRGRFNIMVATDIAARGIDCDRITHVINYDMPDTVETYTHRIGRTGRAGRAGSAVSFVTREDKTQVRTIERVMKISIEPQSACAFGTYDNAPADISRNHTAPSGRKTSHPRRRKSGRMKNAAA
jgi:superfamily II DNA/RNA helicase